MPQYALMGATGGTGTAILRYLLENPPKELTLNILIRNKPKLLNQFPDLEENSSFTVNIIEGGSQDTAAIRRCITGCSIIMQCIASNVSSPGASLGYDTTCALIDTLKEIQKDDPSSYQTPTILYLRAAPLNKAFGEDIPAFAEAIMWYCLHYCYSDHAKASTFYESTARENPDLMHYIFVDPPGLQDPNGMERTGYVLLTTNERRLPPGLMYADLGAAFCEIAERQVEFRNQGVGVGGTGKIKMTPSANLAFAFWGAVYRTLGLLGLM